jgi:hypothetical protein
LKVGDLRKQPSFDNPFLPEGRYAHLHLASILAATVTLLIARRLRADPIYPYVFNTSHATPEVAAIE